ncbi:MAG: saccharopine dehydrogenase NADP-binding domain-containing protein [Candidatus Sericytochromatia bacterium]|nr:saccharopine dehydrogenase NADP-binding domain-containing protein [Candidatus Sericytochromatia bacterium]
MSKPWLIYGANGYTGTLIAETAVAQGLHPILAGRSEARLRPLAERLGLPWRVANLDDPAAMATLLADVGIVVHSAGPFVHTAEPMMQACLAAGTHYLDITGEIPVFERAYALDAEARRRGVCLIPGVGFDVVPSDCLARYVADRVVEPWSLDIAIATDGQPSAGTAKSALESVFRGGLVRQDGALVPYAFGKGPRNIRFSDRRRLTMVIPWGDLASAYRSTRIPNITTLMALPRESIRTLSRMQGLLPLVLPVIKGLMGVPGIQALINRLIAKRILGPDADARQSGACYIWAEALDKSGEGVAAWLETADGYQFTAAAAVASVQHLLAEPRIGALTPAQAFGADFVLTIPGTRRFDSLPAESGLAASAE